MGATISTCIYDSKTFQWGKCECLNCKTYLPRENVDKIIRQYIAQGKIL